MTFVKIASSFAADIVYQLLLSAQTFSVSFANLLGLGKSLVSDSTTARQKVC